MKEQNSEFLEQVSCNTAGFPEYSAREYPTHFMFHTTLKTTRVCTRSQQSHAMSVYEYTFFFSFCKINTTILLSNLRNDDSGPLSSKIEEGAAKQQPHRAACFRSPWA
jgi:hypothetical protein